jgi:shikimate dehydrogenase
MKQFGLIGRHLGHSWSQDYFTRKFAELGLEGYSYNLFELSSVEGLKEWALREKLSGFNVTVPYKLAVIPQLDALDEVAAEVGAVNCVTVEDGRLVGHNTDAPAFMQTLEPLTQSHIHAFTQSFILGTGGAARAVAWALRQLDIPYTFVSRHPDQHENAIPYTQLTNALTHSHTDALKHSLLVNATPVGMYPDINRTPFDLSPFTSHLSPLIVYDLIYNPSPTLLLRQAAERGARVKDGLEMLHRQADLNWQLWGENK